MGRGPPPPPPPGPGGPPGRPAGPWDPVSPGWPIELGPKPVAGIAWLIHLWKYTNDYRASSGNASINLDYLRQFYLLHCLTREQHRPVSWKAPVQLVAWTLHKKIISFQKDIFLQMFRWTLQLGYQRDRRSWKRTKTLNSLSPAILDYHYANV